MLQVPQFVLKKLRCALCEGYLSTGPLMASPNGCQICGRCFKILPDDKKSDLVRQIGLEAVASLFMFPCRHNVHGCRFTFPWNHGRDHESTCPRRNDAFSADDSTKDLIDPRAEESGRRQEHRCDSDEVSMAVTCETFRFEQTDKLKINIDLTGKCDDVAILPSANEVHIDGLLTLGPSPSINYFSFNLDPVMTRGSNDKHFATGPQEDNIYETIASLRDSKNCSTVSNSCNCGKKLGISDEIYHCGSGHNTCRHCKGGPCVVCGREIRLQSRFHCRNFDKGCQELLLVAELNKHHSDCDYRSLTCEICYDFTGIYSQLMEHLVTDHVQGKDVILGSQISPTLTRKDRTWYFFCFERLFICKYYYFEKLFVEFVIKCVGRDVDARSHNYEVSHSSDFFVKEQRTKRAKCLGWNATVLEKAVIFQLQNEMTVTNLKFQANVSIVA